VARVEDEADMMGPVVRDEAGPAVLCSVQSAAASLTSMVYMSEAATDCTEQRPANARTASPPFRSIALLLAMLATACVVGTACVTSVGGTMNDDAARATLIMMSSALTARPPSDRIDPCDYRRPRTPVCLLCTGRAGGLAAELRRRSSCGCFYEIQARGAQFLEACVGLRVRKADLRAVLRLRDAGKSLGHRPWAQLLLL